MPPAPAVEDARSDFLADARRPGDEDAAAGSGDALQRGADIVARRAGAGEFVRRSRFLAQLLIFELQSLILGRARDEVEQPVGLDRLFDEFERAAARAAVRRV